MKLQKAVHVPLCFMSHFLIHHQHMYDSAFITTIFPAHSFNTSILSIHTYAHTRSSRSLTPNTPFQPIRTLILGYSNIQNVLCPSSVAYTGERDLSIGDAPKVVQGLRVINPEASKRGRLQGLVSLSVSHSESCIKHASKMSQSEFSQVFSMIFSF